MKLKEFVEKYVCNNTTIRLWMPFGNGSRHKMLCKNAKEICMDWELLNNFTWQSKYSGYEVIGITDICTDNYKEAVNIVIAKRGE